MSARMTLIFLLVLSRSWHQRWAPPQHLGYMVLGIKGVCAHQARALPTKPHTQPDPTAALCLKCVIVTVAIYMFFIKICFYICVCACVCTNKCYKCVQMFMEARRRGWIPWSWSYIQAVVSGCQEPNLGRLEEQQGFFITDKSLHICLCVLQHNQPCVSL